MPLCGENMVIAKATLVEDTYKTIYDILYNGLIGVSIYASFPDTAVTTKTNYPFVIINSPDLNPLANLSLGNKLAEVSFSITIDIFATQAKKIDELSSDIIDLFDTQKANIQTSGLYIVGSHLTRTASTDFMRDGIKVHQKSLVFGYRFTYQRS